MSDNTTEEMEMATKPLAEHEWLGNLIGTWKTSCEMMMGEGEKMHSSGTEVVTSLGGLWAFGEGVATMPDGSEMQYKSALGFDVSFKEYRGCWFASASSHLWKQTGTLSADGKRMTLDCVGPDMMRDGETANYRDVIDLIDENTRTMTSFAEGEDGSWTEFMKVTFTRA